MKNFLSCLLVATFVCGFWTHHACAYSGPETVAQAIAQVKAITNPNPQVQAEMRAKKAMELVRARVSVLNNGWGTFFQTMPIDVWNRFSKWSSFKARAEAIAALRNQKGVDSAEAAWIIGGGMCAEHASLVKRILDASGVPTTVLTSTGPHDFPVANLPPHAVADIPWTWGNRFIVADSWTGEVITDPATVWHHSMFFNSGKSYVYAGSKLKEGAMREKLRQFVDRGKQWIEAGRCAEYEKMYAKYMLIPEADRPDSNFPPDNVCHIGWLGTWKDNGKPARGPGMRLNFSKVNGVLGAYAMGYQIPIVSISDNEFHGSITLPGEGGKYDFWLTKSGRGTAQGTWRFTTAVKKDFSDFPWNAILTQDR